MKFVKSRFFPLYVFTGVSLALRVSELYGIATCLGKFKSRVNVNYRCHVLIFRGIDILLNSP